ncbi:MAG: biopolymer transporter ExbD [Hydrogenothermaceae bacterium]|nr:biopolymer transporter ExbD [Hydrogenothermaceae bacterium]
MKLIDKDEKEISEINMTPFVDIILVILIIFLATATFIVEGKIPLDLPTAKTSEPAKQLQDKIEIVIKKNGIFFQGNLVNLEILKEKLKPMAQPEKVVVLKAEKDVVFQNVVSVIDVCRQAGISKYVVETKKEP